MESFDKIFAKKRREKGHDYRATISKVIVYIPWIFVFSVQIILGNIDINYLELLLICILIKTRNSVSLFQFNCKISKANECQLWDNN